MPRRRTRAAVTAAVCVLAALLAACSSALPQDRLRPGPPPAVQSAPNIIFVLTDDLSRNLVRYMPHVQGMQRAGLTMKNYYVVDSLCCPSRAAIFTGEYPHDNGVKANSGPHGGYPVFQNRGDQNHTFAVSLHAAGYRTGFMGKYLNGYFPYQPVPPGWDRWDATGRAYHEFYYAFNENGTIRPYGHQPRDYLTDVVSRKASQFIRSAKASGRPFALELSTFAPHSPAVPAPRDANLFPDLRPPHTKAFNRTPKHASRWLANIPPLTKFSRTWIDTLFARRVRCVQAVDRMIGHLEQLLRQEGLADDTYLIFSSDNGLHMGEYRLRPGKETAFDTDIRVPLIVTGPGVPAGATTDLMASSIDLTPTFDDIAHAPIPSTVDGTSLLPLWHGQHPRDWQNAILVEHLQSRFWLTDPDRQGRLNGDPPSYEAIRTQHALYVRYVDGEHDYFNTDRDPSELDNRYASAPRRVLRPLRRQLAALAHCHGAAGCQAAARMHH